MCLLHGFCPDILPAFVNGTVEVLQHTGEPTSPPLYFNVTFLMKKLNSSLFYTEWFCLTGAKWWQTIAGQGITSALSLMWSAGQHCSGAAHLRPCRCRDKEQAVQVCPRCAAGIARAGQRGFARELWVLSVAWQWSWRFGCLWRYPGSGFVKSNHMLFAWAESFPGSQCRALSCG